MKSDHRSKFSNKPEKIRASTGFEPRDLCDIGAMLYQLSYEATHWSEVNSNCSIWKIYCDDHSSLSSTTAVQI